MTTYELLHAAINTAGSRLKLAHHLTVACNEPTSERTIYNWQARPRRLRYAAIWHMAQLCGVDMRTVKPEPREQKAAS